MKTQKTTTKQDNRTIQQVAKSVVAMRRRVGAAIRKHAKLQVRIAKLEAEGRIVSLSHDSDIVVGIDCWYLKSDGLNIDPDSATNWYYETTYSQQSGYGCSCESPNECKHIRKLGATFAPVKKVAAVVSHETEGKLPQETRQKLYNWKQSESGDAMEREYNAAQETADSNLRAFYNGL